MCFYSPDYNSLQSAREWEGEIEKRYIEDGRGRNVTHMAYYCAAPDTSGRSLLTHTHTHTHTHTQTHTLTGAHTNTDTLTYEGEGGG